MSVTTPSKKPIERDESPANPPPSVTTLQPCPCGSTKFRRSTHLRFLDTEILRITPEGHSAEAYGIGPLEPMTKPRTVRCDRCNRQAPNPDYQP